MPFDPAKPAPGDVLDAVLILAQLNALKALIDAQAAQIAAQSAQIATLQGQLTTAISGTAQNIPGISLLGLSISNNPTQPTDVQPIADKVDELINTLLRP